MTKTLSTATSVLQLLREPIDAVYTSTEEFLWDFWPHMPWNPDAARAVASWILLNDEARHTVRAFDVRHGLEGEYSVEQGMMATCAGNEP